MYTNAYFYFITFSTTTAAMEAEKYVKKFHPVAFMPAPQEIGSGCGLALRFLKPEESDLLDFCRTLPFSGNLYKMNTNRKDGHHPIDKLLSF